MLFLRIFSESGQKPAEPRKHRFEKHRSAAHPEKKHSVGAKKSSVPKKLPGPSKSLDQNQNALEEELAEPRKPDDSFSRRLGQLRTQLMGGWTAQRRSHSSGQLHQHRAEHTESTTLESEHSSAASQHQP